MRRPDEDVATLFDMVQKVFQKLLECMARSFKKQPEEGLRVLTPSQDGLLVPQTGVLGAASPHTQAQLALACAPGWGAPLCGRQLPSAVLHVLLADLQSVGGRRGGAVCTWAGGPRAHP